MIRMVAKILDDIVKVRFPHSSFIGHIGGDDFIMVLNDVDKGESVLKDILTEFELNKIYLFSDVHRLDGKIYSKDRFGIERRFNLTSLSISAISGDLSVYNDLEHLSTELAALKKETKMVSESSYRIVQAKCKKVCT
jgi:GGDEF domain-containing protein